MQNLAELVAPQREKLTIELERDTTALVRQYQGFVVADVDTYMAAGETITLLAGAEKRIAEFFKPMKDAAFKLHKEICAREKTLLSPVQTLTASLKRAALDWKRAEEQRRQDEERQAQAAVKKVLDDQALAQAEALQAAGQPELAAMVLDQAAAAPAPTVVLAPAAPKVEGISTRTIWKWRPIGGDTPEARARAVQLVPRDLLTLDDQKISGYVQAMKGAARIPGLEVYPEEVMAGSARVA